MPGGGTFAEWDVIAIYNGCPRPKDLYSEPAMEGTMSFGDTAEEP